MIKEKERREVGRRGKEKIYEMSGYEEEDTRKFDGRFGLRVDEITYQIEAGSGRYIIRITKLCWGIELGRVADLKITARQRRRGSDTVGDLVIWPHHSLFNL
jgi:hypothetical protein